MLVLSRKEDQGVTLIHEATGEQIHVVINRVEASGKVRLGFTAEQHWRILRDELVDTQDTEAK